MSSCVAEGLYCPLTFDGLSCWNYTLAGETAILPCPYFVAGFDSQRKCTVRYLHKADIFTSLLFYFHGDHICSVTVQFIPALQESNQLTVFSRVLLEELIVTKSGNIPPFHSLTPWHYSPDGRKPPFTEPKGPLV
jgi:hypothetical protein